MSTIFAIYSEITQGFSNGSADFKSTTELLKRAGYPSTHSVWYFESEAAYQEEKGKPVLLVVELPDPLFDGCTEYHPVDCSDARCEVTASRAISATYGDLDTDADLDVLDKHGQVAGYVTYDGRVGLYRQFTEFDEDLEATFVVHQIKTCQGAQCPQDAGIRVDWCNTYEDALEQIVGKNDCVVIADIHHTNTPAKIFKSGLASWIVFQDLHKVAHKSKAHFFKDCKGVK